MFGNGECWHGGATDGSTLSRRPLIDELKQAPHGLSRARARARVKARVRARAGVRMSPTLSVHSFPSRGLAPRSPYPASCPVAAFRFNQSAAEAWFTHEWSNAALESEDIGTIVIGILLLAASVLVLLKVSHPEEEPGWHPNPNP